MDVAVSTRSAKMVSRGLGMLIDKLGLPDPGNPRPPGPWDPVIRALDLGRLVSGPQPEPWRRVDFTVGPELRPWNVLERVAGPVPDPWRALAFDVYGSLNTPWRDAILTIIRRRDPRVEDAIGGWGVGWDRVALNPQPLPPRWAYAVAAATELAKRADLMADLGRASGSGGGAARWVAELVDDICGTPPRPWPWPWPWPRPNWLIDPVDSADLAVVASVLDAAAGQVMDGDLSRGLEDQVGRLAEVALERLG